MNPAPNRRQERGYFLQTGVAELQHESSPITRGLVRLSLQSSPRSDPIWKSFIAEVVCWVRERSG